MCWREKYCENPQLMLEIYEQSGLEKVYGKFSNALYAEGYRGEILKKVFALEVARERENAENPVPAEIF